MIVVTGHLEVDPDLRERHLALSAEAVRQARRAPGCLDFAVSADPVETDRVNVAERWRDRASLDAFRGEGEGDEITALIRAAHLVELEVPEDGPGASDPASADEDALRGLLDERARAVAARDEGPLLARMAPDLHSFGVTPPFATLGRDEIADGMRAWFDGYRSAIGYQVHDPRVRVDGDLGVTTFVYRVTGTLTSGHEVDMWVRATAVWERGEDGWVAVHQHESVPWDTATGRGVLAPASPDEVTGAGSVGG